MLVPWMDTEVDVVNLTGKTLIFPDGLVIEPNGEPPDVRLINEKVGDRLGVPLFREHCEFVGKYGEYPLPEYNQIFLVDQYVAKTYWDMTEEEGIYAVFGVEDGDRIIVSHLMAKW